MITAKLSQLEVGNIFVFNDIIYRRKNNSYRMADNDILLILVVNLVDMEEYLLPASTKVYRAATINSIPEGYIKNFSYLSFGGETYYTYDRNIKWKGGCYEKLSSKIT